MEAADKQKLAQEMYFNIRAEINERESNSFSVPWTALTFVAALVAASFIKDNGSGVLILSNSRILLLILSIFPILSVVAMYQFTSQGRMIILLQAQAAAIEAVYLSPLSEIYMKQYGTYFNSNRFLTIRLSTYLILPYFMCANLVVFYLMFPLVHTIPEQVAFWMLAGSVAVGFVVMGWNNLRNNSLRQKVYIECKSSLKNGKRLEVACIRHPHNSSKRFCSCKRQPKLF